MSELATPTGPARVHVHRRERAPAALVLGHGAGGGVSASDLVAATKGALSAGLSVVLVEQPYRVAGRRSPPPAEQLDAAWVAVITQLGQADLAGLAVIAGGRSSGARVACRTALDTGAAGVICLAFPLHPPGKGADPAKSRLSELDAVAVPTLVVQGDSDPFGMPPAAGLRTVIRVPGNHALRNTAAVTAAVYEWLATRFP